MKRTTRSAVKAICIGGAVGLVFNLLSAFSAGAWSVVWGLIGIAGGVVFAIGLLYLVASLGRRGGRASKPKRRPSFLRRVADAGYRPWLVAGASAFYGYLAWLQLVEAMTAVIAQDPNRAAAQLIWGVVLLWLVKVFAGLTIDAASSNRKAARDRRIDARAEELARGPMEASELRALADAATDARDWEEAAALLEAAGRVMRRDAERRHDEAIAFLRETNERARADLDRIRLGRLNEGAY